MTMRPYSKMLLFAPVLLLAACGDEAEVDTEDDGREASGEVLEGSISDAMLPVDRVRSQAPLVVASPAPASPAAEEGEAAAEDPAATSAEPAAVEAPAEPAE
ncbi:hypothetical protein OZN62_06505 [Aurantiacibacter sp. MUD11]|uniref:hypothetical protein n=1 Tax=Aurantiacibacter sp. MUD11 TaxID=3003265 RepID=UPI0022AAA342|nr:hypothetical protein [Aurantiacibacter sp. MUD11]WAT19212.1 hypothetical protein OZN62_06505 [Aurantiacibacter sp. MUD11]